MTLDLAKIDPSQLALTVRDDLVQLMGTIHADAISAAVSQGVADYWATIPEYVPPAPPPPVKESWGFDVSGHQPSDIVEQLLTRKRYSFGIIKASEGAGGFNSRFAAQADALRKSGLRAGWYHFGWLNQDPIADARNFLARCMPMPGECLFLDVENWGVTDPMSPNYAKDKAMRDATPWSQRLDYVLRFNRFIRSETGAVPLVYANWDYIKGLRLAAGMVSTDGWKPTPTWEALTRSPLWIAQYRNPGTYDTVSGDWEVEVQQYTTNVGALDENWLLGPVDAVWDRYCIR